MTGPGQPGAHMPAHRKPLHIAEGKFTFHVYAPTKARPRQHSVRWMEGGHQREKTAPTRERLMEIVEEERRRVRLGAGQPTADWQSVDDLLDAFLVHSIERVREGSLALKSFSNIERHIRIWIRPALARLG